MTLLLRAVIQALRVPTTEGKFGGGQGPRLLLSRPRGKAAPLLKNCGKAAFFGKIGVWQQ
jgi:hypothetical protein